MTPALPAPGSSCECEAHSEEETRRLAQVFAPGLQPGDIVALQGPLGAGKTCFVRAIVAALGGPAAAVSSPTFTLVQQYPCQPAVTHVDAYRLSGPGEFLALGGEELLFGEEICLIEWADRLGDLLPESCWTVEITPLAATARRFEIRCGGPSGAARIQDLQQRLMAGGCDS